MGVKTVRVTRRTALITEEVVENPGRPRRVEGTGITQGITMVTTIIVTLISIAHPKARTGQESERRTRTIAKQVETAHPASLSSKLLTGC